jgi:hypothetical protein
MLTDRNGEHYLTAEEFSRGHGAGLGPLNNGAVVHLEDAEKLILLRVCPQTSSRITKLS